MIFEIHPEVMKYRKVKNPCTICFQSVSNRNGLQCKGACRKWAHFKCLNYTPEKINEINAGCIKITCPCPNCITPEPKEMPTNNHGCFNPECPVSKPLSCKVPECPNKQYPIPAFSPPTKRLPTDFDNFETTSPKYITSPKKSPLSPRKSCSAKNISLTRKCSPPKKSSSPSRKASPRRRSSSAIKISLGPKCLCCPKHCPKNSHRNLDQEKFSPRQSQSCSLNSSSTPYSGNSHFATPSFCSSDSALLNGQDQKMLYCAIEQMYEAVGQLSTQLKDFMCKMLTTFQKSKQ